MTKSIRKVIAQPISSPKSTSTPSRNRSSRQVSTPPNHRSFPASIRHLFAQGSQALAIGTLLEQSVNLISKPVFIIQNDNGNLSRIVIIMSDHDSMFNAVSSRSTRVEGSIAPTAISSLIFNVLRNMDMGRESPSIEPSFKMREQMSGVPPSALD